MKKIKINKKMADSRIAKRRKSCGCILQDAGQSIENGGGVVRWKIMRFTIASRQSIAI